MIFVIGSGPAGVACASALLGAGARVTMLDAGLELEAPRRRRLTELRGADSRSWTPAELDFLRDGVEVHRGGIPLKLAYGSDFAYRDPFGLPLKVRGGQAKPSYARGGLSNVWGASMLPYRGEDLAGWPLGVDSLAPHYRAVLDLMPFAARADGLAEQFPLHHECPGELPASKQAAALLADLEASAAELSEKGVAFGAARLAVKAADCVRCGKCMYGCPYELIYNTGQTLEQLCRHPRFSYRAGVFVERLSEHGGEVEIRGRELNGAATMRLRGERVFLGTGVFSTARVMLASLEAYDRPLPALDNCYFLLALLRTRGEGNVLDERLHTLAQVFIEMHDPALGKHPAHLQVYTYNELFREEMTNLLGPLAGWLPGVAERGLLGRLLLVQGYLHSDLSAGMTIALHRGTADAPGTLEVAGRPNPRTRPAIAVLQRRLWALRRSIRAFPVPPSLRIGAPGRGFHTGGTFPMRDGPGAFESDKLGRPKGFERVHLVDASVFPSLPATTITLSVMANAHRIGSEAVA
jgi:choline dehydrogenase-like flavoprotein